jgi:hypothetical protein
MAVYEVKGQRYEVPDALQGQELISALEEIASLPESPTIDISEDVGPLEAVAIGAGKGMYDIGRGLGILDPASPVEQKAFEQLQERRPYTTGGGEILGQTAPFLLPGVGIGAIPSTAGRVTASTGLGALEGGTIARATGGDVAESAGIGGTIAGFAEMVFPVLGRISRQIFSRVTGRAPEGALVTPQGSPTPEMQQALNSAGLSWDDMKVTAQDMVAKLPEGADPQQTARLARFKELGIEPTAGQLTQDFPQLKRERGLIESATESASEPFRQASLTQSQGIKSYLDNIIDEMGVSGDVGSSMKDALAGRRKTLLAERKSLYKQLAEESEGLADVPVITEPIKDALPDSRTIRSIARVSPNQFSALNDLLVEFGIEQSDEAIEGAIAKGIDIEPLGLGNFEELRKQLNLIESTDQTGAIANITIPLKRALDDEIDSLAESLESAGGNISQTAKDARKSNVALKTEFDEKKITSKLIDNVKRGSTQPKIEASNAYNKIMSKGAPIEDLERVVASLEKQGSLGQKALKEMQGKAVMDLMDSAFSAQSRQVDGIRTFGATPFSKQYESLVDKYDVLFKNSPKDRAKLDKAYRTAQDLVPPAGAVPKGSAGFFIDALNKAGVYSIMTKVPFARELFEIVKTAGERSKSREFIEKALNAKPDVKRLAWSIDRDYPQMAATLGIAGISQEGEQ